jgi:mannose-6-phosphate isomerase-like protein (cupin superfamily)
MAANRATSNGMQKRILDQPDDRTTFNKGRLDTISLAGLTLAQLTLEPGWKWSESLKEMKKTASCEEPHVIYHVSGRLRVRTNGGDEEEFGPGEVSLIPAGHDAWVVGNERVVALEIMGSFQDQEYR